MSECRWCGSRSYGGGCINSPTGKHEHIGDNTNCEFCGSSSYGGGCHDSPSRKHRHGHGGGKCRWCGSRSFGGGCTNSPTLRPRPEGLIFSLVLTTSRHLTPHVPPQLSLLVL